jgi:hypothetical protein
LPNIREIAKLSKNGKADFKVLPCPLGNSVLNAQYSNSSHTEREKNTCVKQKTAMGLQQKYKKQ